MLMFILMLVSTALLSMSCNRDVVVKLPPCVPKVVQICDSEVHAGQYAVSSWDNHPVYKVFSFANMAVDLPESDKAYRICRNMNTCDRQEDLGPDYAVDANLPGFWIDDRSMALLWSILETAFSKETVQAALAWGQRLIHTMPIDTSPEAEEI